MEEVASRNGEEDNAPCTTGLAPAITDADISTAFPKSFSKGDEKTVRENGVPSGTLFITDSSKTSFFDDLQVVIKNFLKEYKISDLELDHRKIKSVEDERGLLRQMGVTKKIISSYL